MCDRVNRIRRECLELRGARYHDGVMRRMMIQADEALLDRARRRAADRGVSVAQLVREALERELGPATPPPEVRCAGVFGSGKGDLARRASEGIDYEPPPFRS